MKAAGSVRTSASTSDARTGNSTGSGGDADVAVHVVG